MDMNTRNAVNWFEIPVRDMDRAQRFYETVFGITMPRTEMDGHLMAMFPAHEDGVNGCLSMGEGCEPGSQGATVYLNAEPGVQEVLSRVERAGGRVVIGRTEVSGGHGYFAQILDPEGNRVGLHAMH
ncbi:MAG: VOC family protein [Pseudomonadota bacterium]